MKFLKWLGRYIKQECPSLSSTRKTSLFQRVSPRRLLELPKVCALQFCLIFSSETDENIIHKKKTLHCREVLLFAKCFRCCYLICNKGSFISFEEFIKPSENWATKLDFCLFSPNVNVNHATLSNWKEAYSNTKFHFSF